MDRVQVRVLDRPVSGGKLLASVRRLTPKESMTLKVDIQTVDEEAPR